MSKIEVKLICLPYAGGSSSIYFRWKNLLKASGMELIAPELAGRGTRLSEPLYTSIVEAAEDMYHRLLPEIHTGNYSIFGHSMGSLIAFELLNKIRENNQSLPIHMFFSGRGAPHIPDNNRIIYHALEENEFIKEIIKLGGTTKQVFDDPDLREMFIPILRNDLKITETYLHENIYKPFKTNFSVFIGKTEDASYEQIDGWKIFTTKNFDTHYFDGGHFFINDEYPEMIKVIEESLSADLLTQ